MKNLGKICSHVDATASSLKKIGFLQELIEKPDKNFRRYTRLDVDENILQNPKIMKLHKNIV